MDPYLIAIGSALWLGILTSISPCPLATNVAAISYIGNRVDRPALVLFSGMLYTMGRTVTYVTIGMLAVKSALSLPEVAMFLQEHTNKYLGPLLLAVGLLLLGIFKINLPGMAVSEKVTARLGTWGVWGAGLLGIIFALSFCPVSAALFFGSLVPLAIEQHSVTLMPTAYGVGTALPVAAFAVLISLGVSYLGAMFDRLTVIERWARKITGVIFVLVGAYYIASYLIGWQ